MKCEISKLDGLKRKLDIQISAEQVRKSFDENYRKKQQKTNLPGFRKGKVPINHIRSLYYEEIKRDTTLSLINKFYLKAVEQEQLKPASEPKIDLKSHIEEDQAFGFSAVLEVQPDINIDKYFKVRVSTPSMEVEEKEVDQALENIRLASATFELVKEKRAVDWGDIVELEIKELSGPLGIEKQPMLEIKKESQAEVKGLIEGVMGMRSGDEKKISVDLPESYPVKEHAGKSADLEVTVLAIKKKILPDLDNQLAERFKCKDVEKMRSVVRQSIETEKRSKAYDSMREQALKELVEKNPVSLLPEGVVEDQKQAIISSVISRLKESGMKKEDIEKYKEKYRKDFQEQARFMVHSSYLIYTLAKQLNISVSPQEVKMYIQKLDSDQNKSEDKYERMKNFLIREKTLNHLIDSAINKKSDA